MVNQLDINRLDDGLLKIHKTIEQTHLFILERLDS